MKKMKTNDTLSDQAGRVCTTSTCE